MDYMDIVRESIKLGCAINQFMTAMDIICACEAEVSMNIQGNHVDWPGYFIVRNMCVKKLVVCSFQVNHLQGAEWNVWHHDFVSDDCRDPRKFSTFDTGEVIAYVCEHLNINYETENKRAA